MTFSTVRGGSQNTPGEVSAVQAAPVPGAPARVFCPGCGRFVVELVGMTSGGCRVRCRHCKANVFACVDGARVDVKRDAPGVGPSPS